MFGSDLYSRKWYTIALGSKRARGQNNVAPEFSTTVDFTTRKIDIVSDLER
jgi:hypothetical protein